MIDLHSHTTASDGSLTPAELVDKAVEIKLEALAITDHDTIAGLKEAMARGKELGLEVISGVEISSDVDELDVHLVGLFFDPKNPEIDKKLKEMALARSDRNYKMVNKLKKAGFDISRHDIDALGKDKQIARGHIAEILIDRGYASTLREALDGYLIKGKAGYVKKKVLSPQECIDLIHNAGGLIFVAHINQIDPENPQKSVEITKRLISMGADGLETIYSEYDEFWAAVAEKIAGETGCLRSGGSDFHGKMKKNLYLGFGYGNLEVPYKFIKKMKEKLKI
ncbi:PHP domain-containing protein [Alkalibacter mobilis]|uniref:PHP domain-containing protein n=1 Tax=Alkalibacter mobilis TaxID=2787712 RepID=UPI0018A0DCF0|nr:PHP domain-containing protein [Alkalibacter mobilis]MBF7095807.1 PHP domain-containing protein [Alkalibacter mobilis]